MPTGWVPPRIASAAMLSMAAKDTTPITWALVSSSEPESRSSGLRRNRSNPSTNSGNAAATQRLAASASTELDANTAALEAKHSTNRSNSRRRRVHAWTSSMFASIPAVMPRDARLSAIPRDCAAWLAAGGGVMTMAE